MVQALVAGERNAELLTNHAVDAVGGDERGAGEDARPVGCEVGGLRCGATTPCRYPVPLPGTATKATSAPKSADLLTSAHFSASAARELPVMRQVFPMESLLLRNAKVRSKTRTHAFYS